MKTRTQQTVNTKISQSTALHETAYE